MKKLLIRWKVYFDRARMYISYVQTLIVVLTFLKVFGIVPPVWAVIPLVLALISLCLLVGWVDMKLGIFDAEQQRISEQNPMLVEILARLKK